MYLQSFIDTLYYYKSGMYLETLVSVCPRYNLSVVPTNKTQLSGKVQLLT
jgi:hypothetical protein